MNVRQTSQEKRGDEARGKNSVGKRKEERKNRPKAIDKEAAFCFADYMTAEQGNNPAEKVKVVGRIGQAPQYRSVPDQQHPGQDLLIGNFSIAEHPDEGNRDATVWHEVATFGDRTRRFQEQFDRGELRVGQEVEVVGTVHRRERPTKDGGTKTVEQIYAYAVKPVRRDQETDKGPAAGPGDLQPPDWK